MNPNAKTATPRSKRTSRTAPRPAARRPASSSLAKRRPSVATATPTAFAGYASNAMSFWFELAAEMSREWFMENKARYQAEWEAPTKALLAHVQAALAPHYKPQKVAAPKVMRIHRDVRFSNDKAPYKTHIGAMLTVENPRGGTTGIGDGGCAALYFHLGADEDFAAVGTYRFAPEQLTRWRKAIIGKPGAALHALMTELRDQGYTVGGHDDYKRVPAGLDANHPRAELLKLRGLTAIFPAIPKGLIHQPSLADWLVTHATATAPLVKWLTKNT